MRTRIQWVIMIADEIVARYTNYDEMLKRFASIKETESEAWFHAVHY